LYDRIGTVREYRLVNALHYTFYGITLQVCCNDPEVASRVASDFSHFRAYRETTVWSGKTSLAMEFLRHGGSFQIAAEDSLLVASWRSARRRR
jgi:hypothetical protein